MAKHIAVFGSPNSGKSVFSALIADLISKDKKEVILISGDKIVPMLPFFSKGKSGLGSLFSNELNSQNIAKAVNILKENTNIGIMAYELKNKKDYTFEQLSVLSDVLDSIVDVIIWDCMSDVNDIFFKFAIYVSNLKVCLITADLKGLLYYKTNEEYFCNINKLIFEGMSKPYSTHEEVSSAIGGFDGVLPFTKELEIYSMAGDIFWGKTIYHRLYKEALELTVKKLEV